MTRWAKAGNSQKHKKMPEDSTPWEELSKNIGTNKSITMNQQSTIANFDKITHKVIKKSGIKCIKEAKHQEKIANQFLKDDKLLENFTNYNIKKKTKNIHKIKQKKDTDEKLKDESFKIEESLSKKALRKHEIKKKLVETEDHNEFIIPCLDKNLVTIDNNQLNSKDFVENDDILSSNNQSAENLRKSKKQLKKNKKRKNKFPEKSSILPNSNKEENVIINDNVSPSKKPLSKKELFRIRLQKKRTELGMMLLPSNIENRLYRIKKRLREKGFLPDQIKKIIREERAKAETHFRQTYNINKMICYSCRQFGHRLVDCPNHSPVKQQETRICFKCGSAEHTSTRCREKVTGFPFATCFICKAVGHISRDCPSNKHGIYPKGGKCNLCDSIYHLKKDCPTLKKKDDELAFTLSTINEGMSIDDETINLKEEPERKKMKKPKVVKF